MSSGPETSPPVQTVTVPVTYRPGAGELPKQIGIEASYVPSPDILAPLNTLVAGGLGFEGLSGRAAKIAAEKEGLTGAIFVDRLPYHIPDSDAESLEEFASQAFNSITDYVQSELSDGPLNAVGESQAGAGIMEFVRRNPGTIKGGIAFLRGLGTVPGMSIPSLLTGLGKSGLQRDSLVNPAAPEVAWSAVKDFVRSLRDGNGMLRYAIGYSLIPGLQEIVTKHPAQGVYVIAGRKDKLLPAERQAAALQEVGLKDRLYVVEGPHVTLAGVPGAKQLAHTIEHIKSDGKTLPRYS